MKDFLDILIDVSMWLKIVVITILSGILNFFTPVYYLLYVILMLVTLDIFWGIRADKGDFSKKKFFHGLTHMAIYLLLIGSIYSIGIMMRYDTDDTLNFTSWVTWVVNYCLFTNSLRNMKTCHPDNEPVKFLYWFFTFKFIDKISYLKEYKNKNNEKN